MQGVVSKSILKAVLASVFALVLVAGVASAKGDRSATVDINQNAQVLNGPMLQPGTYQVKVLSESGTPQVGFYLNHKLVGQAAATLVDKGQKSSETAAHFNNANGNHVLTQIDVNGWTKSIQFGPSTGANGSIESGQ
jgi:hypothetical protein